MQAVEITRTARIWSDADGIVCINAFPGVEETLEDAKQVVDTVGKLAAGKRRPLLIDIRVLKTQSRAVRTFYAAPENQKELLALALLIASPISRVIGNFFLGFNKVDTPTKLFKSEVEALTWLKGFLG